MLWSEKRGLKKKEVNHIKAAQYDERTNDEPPFGKQN